MCGGGQVEPQHHIYVQYPQGLRFKSSLKSLPDSLCTLLTAVCLLSPVLSSSQNKIGLYKNKHKNQCGLNLCSDESLSRVRRRSGGVSLPHLLLLSGGWTVIAPLETKNTGYNSSKYIILCCVHLCV